MIHSDLPYSGNKYADTIWIRSEGMPRSHVPRIYHEIWRSSSKIELVPHGLRGFVIDVPFSDIESRKWEPVNIEGAVMDFTDVGFYLPTTSHVADSPACPASQKTCRARFSAG